MSGTNNINEIVINGTLDMLNNDLDFLISMRLITDDQRIIVYDHIAEHGYCPEIQGLQELADWVRKLWVSYIQYNKLPPNIINKLSEDLPHISSNYIEYIKSNASLINLSDNLSVDIKGFIELHDHVIKFFPKSKIANILSDIKSIIINISPDNIQQVINNLYVQSKKLEYTSGLSEILLRKVRAQINRIRLQLESVQSRIMKNAGNSVDAKFYSFLQGEGISDTISMVINKL